MVTEPGVTEHAAVDLAGQIRDARSNENPCEHWVGQELAVCSPCLRDRLMPHFAAALLAIEPRLSPIRCPECLDPMDPEDTGLATTAAATPEPICTCPEGHEAQTREGAMLAEYCPTHGTAAATPPTAECDCPPCPGRGNDGHGMQHCAECCFGTGVEADITCPIHGEAAIPPTAEALHAATIEALAVEAESWPDDEDDSGGAVADWLRSRIPLNTSPAGSPAPTMDPSARANGGSAVASRTPPTGVQRGKCTCGEVNPENRLGHRDGCRYFSGSTATPPTASHDETALGCDSCAEAHPHDGCADVGCDHNCEAAALAARAAASHDETALPGEIEFIDTALTLIHERGDAPTLYRSDLGRVYDWLAARAATGADAGSGDEGLRAVVEAAFRERGIDPTPAIEGEPFQHREAHIRGRVCYRLADGSGTWWPQRWEGGQPNTRATTFCLGEHRALAADTTSPDGGGADE